MQVRLNAYRLDGAGRGRLLLTSVNEDPVTMLSVYRELSTRILRDSGSHHENDLVAVETETSIVLDGEVVARLLHLPGNEAELAVGHILTEGLVEGPMCIIGVRTEGSVVHLDTTGRAPVDGSPHSQVRMAPDPPSVLAASTLFGIGAEVRTFQTVHGKTGATHVASVFDIHSGRQFAAEDIGRLNAIDKAVGLAVSASVNLHDSLVIVSGRLTERLVRKCLRVDVAGVVSFAVATTGAISLAEEHHMTLVGSLREDSARIYCEGRTGFY